MYNQGDVIIVPFPFTDLTGVKQRPALIISNKEYIRNSPDVIICGITSNLKDLEYSVLLEKRDLNSGFIILKSLIKVDKLTSVDKNIIRKKIATIKQSKLQEVFEILDKIIK